MFPEKRVLTQLAVGSVLYTSSFTLGEVVPIPTFPFDDTINLSTSDVLRVMPLTFPPVVLSVVIPIPTLCPSLLVPLSHIQKASTHAVAYQSILLPREIAPFTSSFAVGVFVPIPTFPEVLKYIFVPPSLDCQYDETGAHLGSP